MHGLPVSVRTSAVALAISGLLVAAGTPWHPSIFDRPVAEVVQEFDAWTVLHAVAVIGVLLAFVGAVGLVVAHEGRLGMLGRVGLILCLFGVVGASGLVALEATVFPVLAEENPELLEIGGPLLGSPLVIGGGLLTLGWPLGLSILGVAAARARDFPLAAGVTLAIGGVAFLAFAGPFVPVAGALAAIVFGLAQVWWGWLMWRGDRTRRSGQKLPPLSRRR